MLTTAAVVTIVFRKLRIPAAILLIARSEFIAAYYLQIETRFPANLNQKTLEDRDSKDAHRLEEDYSIFSEN